MVEPPVTLAGPNASRSPVDEVVELKDRAETMVALAPGVGEIGPHRAILIEGTAPFSARRQLPVARASRLVPRGGL